MPGGIARKFKEQVTIFKNMSQMIICWSNADNIVIDWSVTEFSTMKPLAILKNTMLQCNENERSTSNASSSEIEISQNVYRYQKHKSSVKTRSSP